MADNGATHNDSTATYKPVHTSTSGPDLKVIGPPRAAPCAMHDIRPVAGMTLGIAYGGATGTP